MSGAAGVPGAAVRRFVIAAIVCAGLLPVLAFALVGPDPIALAVATAVFLITALLAAAFMARTYRNAQLGLCNVVTLVRLAITCALVAPLLATGSTAMIFSLASLALVLDGLDGWLARRHGQASDFGARFDMEVDSALGLVLALNAWASGTVGPLVLLLGLPRYLFVAAAFIWPWIDRPLPERFGRKLVCVLQIAALIALQLPVLGGAPALILLSTTIAALVWSFGRDLLWLRAAS